MKVEVELAVTMEAAMTVLMVKAEEMVAETVVKVMTVVMTDVRLQ